MKKSIITTFVCMLVSTVAFADGYDKSTSQKHFEKHEGKHSKKVDNYARFDKDNEGKRFGKPDVKSTNKRDVLKKEDVRKRVDESNYRKRFEKNAEYRKKVDTFSGGDIFRNSDRKTNVYVPVVKNHTFALQFSGFDNAQQKKIIAVFNSSIWGSATLTKNYFTGSITVQISSAWNQQRMLESIQKELTYKGIDVTINGISGYNASFIPATQQYCH